MVSIKCVISVNIGEYDSPVEEHYPNPDWKFIMFTDKDFKSPVWQKIIVDKQTNVKKQTRQYKWLIHRYFDCQYSLYIDASVKIRCDLNTLVKKYLDGYDIAMYKHRMRDCLYDEAKVCKHFELDSNYVIDKQIAWYKKNRYPEHNGLNEGTVILRRHTDSIIKLNEAVWSTIKRGSYRDQLCFNYVAYRLKTKVHNFYGGIKLYKEAKDILDDCIGKKIGYNRYYFELKKHNHVNR